MGKPFESDQQIAVPSVNGPSDGWHRELDLLRTLPEDVKKGFEKRVQEASDHPLETCLEIGTSIGVGVAMAWSTKNPSVAARAVETTGKIFAAVGLVDGAVSATKPLALAWSSDQGLKEAHTEQGNFLGGLLFDAPIIAAGSAAGMRRIGGYPIPESVRASCTGASKYYLWAASKDLEFKAIDYLKLTPLNAIASSAPISAERALNKILQNGGG